MCGEHAIVDGTAVRFLGSSPHVRGAPVITFESALASGIIPACAGSTDGVQAILTTDKGSSPHVRGALTIQRPQFASLGIIPACAGSTGCEFFLPDVYGDHPRMCGEHDYKGLVHQLYEGSSPHVRGARDSTC